MRYLLDTNILLRLSQPHDPAYQSIIDSIALLQQQADTEFCFLLQSLSEFWNVCTRPVENNGYGFSIAETDRRARAIEGFCVYLPDTPQVYAEWRLLVVKHSVVGVQVHDAKLAAATSLWLGFGLLPSYGVFASIFGGVLTLAILQLRRMTLDGAAFSAPWIARLREKNGGIPYGIALAAAGLVVYPDTAIWIAARAF